MLLTSFSTDEARESSSLDLGLQPEEDSPSMPMWSAPPPELIPEAVPPPPLLLPLLPTGRRLPPARRPSSS